MFCEAAPPQVQTSTDALPHSLLRLAFSAATSIQRAADKARRGTRTPKKPADATKSVGNQTYSPSPPLILFTTDSSGAKYYESESESE